VGKKQTKQRTVLDGSRLIVESCVRAGAEVYVGYPITPANYIYQYSSQRFPSILHAPDEITTLQWMAGLSATGLLPVTATAFPGLALMVESINMAFMMELPMLIVLVQRLGPSTGSATVGAQGDLLLLRGLISGGYPLPVLAVSDFGDCWELPSLALRLAVSLRSPVVLLTSKEMAMTQRSFDLDLLTEIEPVQWRFYTGQERYRPYATDGGLAPPFLPIGNDRHQVRLTASTHNAEGELLSADEEALENTRRLQKKIETGTPAYYELDEQEGAEAVIVSYGITAYAAREAAVKLRAQGMPVSLLIAKTLLPVPAVYYDILERYRRIVIAEENLQGQMAQILFGYRLPDRVRLAHGIGRLVHPDQIIREVTGS